MEAFFAKFNAKLAGLIMSVMVLRVQRAVTVLLVLFLNLGIQSHGTVSVLHAVTADAPFFIVVPVTYFRPVDLHLLALEDAFIN